MHRAWMALGLACAWHAQAATGADPQSAACRDALAALQARESELSGGAVGRVTADARWQALRRQAARACLGRESAASAPLPQSARPPIAVPPVTVAPPPLAMPPAPAAAPPVLSRPAPSLRACDANGCTTSDGLRVPHTGRDPLDPRVRCTLQGQVALCL
jgi:hypothetical protein